MFDGKTAKEYKVLIQSAFADGCGECRLYGYYHKTSGIFNVTGTRAGEGTRLLGCISRGGAASAGLGLLGRYDESGRLCFSYRGAPYTVEYYDVCLNVFSRNTGILESGVMLGKKAVILGCGSVGSYVALELARAGVGHFLLVDMDIVEYHNLCRHQCGIHDVGAYKVDALAARIRDINPNAEIVRARKPIEELNQKYFEHMCAGTDTVVVGCADNRAADAYANMIAARMGACFLSIGFWERAVAGEIFYWIPGRKMPCCACALGSVNTPKAETNYHHVYSNELDATKIKFEPGISADISFITIIGVKLALDMLNISTEGYVPRLLDHLRQYTLVCNTEKPEIGGSIVEIFSHPLQITRSLKVNFNKNCAADGQCMYE